MRGSLVAYDADTGKEVWRFWTVPGDPAKGFESPALADAATTWLGKDWWKVAAATCGMPSLRSPLPPTGSSSATRAREWITANCAAYIQAARSFFPAAFWRSRRKPASTLRISRRSSAGMQTENNHIVIADLKLQGAQRHVAMTAPKNGFFYVLDAATGKLLAAKPLVQTTWATSYNLASGKADEVPRSKGGGVQWTVHNWWPMSFNPAIGLVYVPTTDRKPGRERRPLRESGRQECKGG